MKKFEFDQNHKMWDRYRAFHATHGPFVEFETGEVMVNYFPRPDGRRYYGRYDIQLVTTSDSDCPQLYFDRKCEQPVTPAWLKQDGQQNLAIDHDQKVAVKLSGWRAMLSTHPEDSLKRFPELQYLPSHLQGAHAVWMGYGRPPVPLTKIAVSAPDKTMKEDMRAKLRDVRDSVRAAARITGVEARPYGPEDKMPVRAEWQDWTVEDICAYVCADTTSMRWAAYGGFEYPRAVTKYDYLHVA